MNRNLLSEKFVPKKLPDICIARPVLMKIFNQHAEKRALLVSAPAGFGKTISTLLWLSNTEKKSIWIGVDEYDNIPSIFYKLLCTGISAAFPMNKVMARLLKNPSFMLTPIEHTINFLSYLDPGSSSYIIILDGWHLITNEEIRKSLPFILKRLPMSFMTVILTCEQHTDYLEPYFKEGKAARITAEELVFSSSEIQRYFKASGLFITPEESITLKTVTGGWPLGVYVAATSGTIHPTDQIDEALKQYIRQQIWNQYDEELQQFMLMTCTVDDITVSLANQMTGREDSQVILDQLCTSNFFISRVDGQYYRYYPIFLHFLRGELDETTRLNKEDLYRSTAAYYRERKEYYNSIRFAAKAKDYEALTADLLEMYEYSTPSGAASEHVTIQDLSRLKESIPESLANQKPYLFISQSWYYYLLGSARHFCDCLDQLYSKLPEIIEQYHPLIKYAIFMTAIDFRKPIFHVSKLITPELMEYAVQSGAKATSLMKSMPFIHRSHRDYSDFIPDIEENMRMAEPVLAALLGTHDTRMSLLLRTMLYYEKNMMQEANACCEQALAILPQQSMPELCFSVQMTRIAVLSALGQINEAETSLARNESIIKEQGYLFLLPNFKAYETKLRLLSGSKQAAGDWFKYYFVTPLKGFELYKISQHFTTVRAYLVLGKTQEAMTYLTELKQLGEEFHRPLDVIESGILQAILEWFTNRRKEAQHTLESVLTTAQTYGYIRIFAEEGSTILPILRKITLKVEQESYSGTLASKYIHDVTFATYEQFKRKKGLIIPQHPKAVKLSRQQKHILELLAAGYKYKEIMELTELTIHTVKSHAAAAYRKLDVNNSMDAVLKARELRLME